MTWYTIKAIPKTESNKYYNIKCLSPIFNVTWSVLLLFIYIKAKRPAAQEAVLSEHQSGMVPVSMYWSLLMLLLGSVSRVPNIAPAKRENMYQ